MTTPVPRLDDALAHTDWVRRLARSLVSEAEAEDLAQDAFEAALTTSADVEQGWLAGVLRNLAAMRHRTTARRTRREAASDVPDAALAPDEVLERLQTQRLLSELVGELPEPLRLVLYLRYYEGLDATAIGARLSLPPGTVRWRLKQGVDTLRERLDARFGERAQWSALLMPLAVGDPSSFSLGTGVLLMKLKNLVAVVALLALVLGACWWWPTNVEQRAGRQRIEAAQPKTQGPTFAADALPVVQGPLPAWRLQPGIAARHVAGHVVMGTEPVAGARVLLSMPQQPSTVSLQERRTDAQGAFDFGVQQPVEVVISANLIGHAATLVELDLRNPDAQPAPDALELRLAETCEARLVGRVLDSGAGPVPSATIGVVGAAGVTTNAQGEFELCTSSGSNNLQVEAPGYGAVLLEVLVLGRTQRDVVLAPEATIVGQVLDDASGAPLADALVTARAAQFQTGNSARGAVALSNAEGRFQLHVPPGDFKVQATASGTASSPTQVISAFVGRFSDEVVLRLRAGVELRGMVRSAGKPIAGAHVRAHTMSTGRSVDAFSQADGRFVLRGVPPGALVFTAAPWSVTRPNRYVATPGGPEVELEVTSQGSLQGVVTRAHVPVAGAQVDLNSSSQTLKAISDARGRYRIDGVPRGSYHLLAVSDAAGAFVEVPAVKFQDAEARTLDLELESAASIEGTVVDAQGKTLAGALVVFSDARTGDEGKGLTDADGKFRATQMQGHATYQPKVYLSGQQGSAAKPAGGPFAGVALVDGNAHLEGVQLRVKTEKFQLSGRAVDASGTPVPDVKVRAQSVGPDEPPQFSAWQVLPLVMTDAQGRFSFESLPSGTWALQGRAPDGSEAVVQVEAGAKDVVLTLRPAARIEGRLVDYAQTPTVYARPLSGGRLIAGQVSGQTFSVALPGGTWVLSVMDNQEGDVQRVELKDGEVKHVTMTSHGRGVVRGRVVDHETQKAMPDLVCHLVVAAGNDPGVTNWEEASSPKTDADGHFVADPAPAGRVAVMCQGDFREMSPSIALVQVERGATVEVNLELALRTPGPPGDIGVSFEQSPLPKVAAVKPGSAAARAGVKAGDGVLAVDGKPIAPLDAYGVEVLISNHAPGTPLSLTLAAEGGVPRVVKLTAE